MDDGDVSDFRTRKALRRAFYKEFVEGWKTVPCGACGGSGKYDYARHGRVPNCGYCNGTGKMKVSPTEYNAIFNPTEV